MYELDVIFLVVFALLSCSLLYCWYKYTNDTHERVRHIKYIYFTLPLASVILVLITLNNFASFDVLGLYIIFYILMGLVWVWCGVWFMFILFDISWIDDSLNKNNIAAALTIVGGVFGLTLIFSGANIGDGPGWWCILFAGGLGVIMWFLLGIIINKTTNVSEIITSDFDTAAGIRFGSYLTASGIILARACAGDWTSFSSTVIEFLDGWPVLLLATIAILIERYYINTKKAEYNLKKSYNAISAAIGVLYIAIAVISVVLLPPLKENPIYNEQVLSMVRSLLL